MNTSPVVLPWRFDGDPPVHAGACVNIRHRGARCSRCADACPVQAITPDPAGPMLDVDACLRCDACVPACPTEALGHGGSLRALRHAIADAPPEDSVTICCPRGGEHARSTAVFRHDRCLAGLGGEELLVLAGSHGSRLGLDDTPCEGCQLAELHATIVAATERANHLAAAFGLRASVVLETSEPPSGAVRQPRVVDAGQAGFSRRALFRKVVGTTIDRAPHDQTALPSTRSRLLQHLRTVSHGSVDSPAEADLGFGDVVVDADRCSACGLCAQLCPTGALQFAITAGTSTTATFELDAHPDRCVACDLCTTACPEDALTVRRSLDPAAVRRGAPVQLLSGPITACEACGAATRSADAGGARCFACRTGVVSPLRDERGLMADLLGRVRV